MPDRVGIQNCGCGVEEHDKIMDPKAVVDELIATLDENETDVQKIAETTHKILKAMCLGDAAEFMTRRQLPVTEPNIRKFSEIYEHAYVIRLEIMKQMLFK